MWSRIKRPIFVGLGFLLVGIGALGRFVPLLPTTPFLLLAAILFSKSSQRFHTWLLNNRTLGPYINHYENGGGVPKKVKIKIIIFLWLSLAVSGLMSIYVFHMPSFARGILALVGIIVSTHIIMIRPKKKKNPSREHEAFL